MRLLAIILFGAIMSGCAFRNEEADLIVHNAVIYTCADDGRIYDAMAIKDGKILEIGPERQIMNKYVSDNVIDNKLRAVYPLFIGNERQPLKAFIKMTKEFQQEDSERHDVLNTLTRFAAIEEMEEETRGTLEKGKEADFFITDGDLVKLPASSLSKVVIVATYNDGKEL